MYPHHERAIEAMKQYFAEIPGVIALVLGGSVAKGNERPDSDIDGMVIVTEEYYRRMEEEGRTAETISGYCDYEGGYFDVKYMTKEYIRAAAEKGSEPTRNSFIGSRLLFSSDPEIEGILQAIPVFQKKEKEEKLLSFYADLMLNYDYYWKGCKPEGFMKVRVASEIVYAVYRLILQENEVLFPCNRRLEETVMRLQNKPEGIVEQCRAFLEDSRTPLLEALVENYLSWTGYRPPSEKAVGSRYVLDFEQWWMYPRPNIAEW